MKNNCKLPHSEQKELRDEVSVSHRAYEGARDRLIGIIDIIAPGATPLQRNMIEVRLEELLSAHEDLISAQNIAIKAGLTAEGE